MKETVQKLTDLALFREIKLLNQCGLVMLTVASIDSLSMHLAQTWTKRELVPLKTSFFVFKNSTVSHTL